jgi:lipopolysaccharide export system protein LptA
MGTHTRWLDSDDDDDEPAGVSTDQMTAAIATAGHIRSIRTHPPLPLTAPVTINVYGTFTLTASSHEIGNRVLENAFDHQADETWRGAWASEETYSTSSGLYEGTARLHPSTPLGEFVTYEQPYRIPLHSFSITPTASSQSLRQMPTDFRVYGTVDAGVTWVLLSQHTDVVFVDRYESPGESGALTFVTNQDVREAFNKFALVVEAIPASATDGMVFVGEFQLHAHIAADKKNGDDVAVIAADVAAVQTTLSTKADASSVYTRAQVDGALVSKADVSSVYTKSQSDALFNLPVWGRILVAYMKVKYRQSTGLFENIESPFNLSASFVSNQIMQFDFVTHRPSDSGYVIDFNSDNQNLNYNNGSGQWYHSSAKSLSGFQMNLYGNVYGTGHTFTVSVYHDDMVLA